MTSPNRIVLALLAIAGVAGIATVLHASDSADGKGRAAAIFQRLDADDSHSLSRDEIGEGRLFERLDTDDDDRVLRSEVPQHPRALGRFDEADRSGDGVLTRKEAEAAASARFRKTDADGDGELSPEEMRAAHAARRAEHAQERFEAADTDRDGALSFDEFSQAGSGRRNGKLDADGDGAIEPGEAPDGPKMERFLEHADANDDGTISADEIAALRRKRFERLDADSDGRLTADEMTAARHEHHRGGRGRPAG